MIKYAELWYIIFQVLSYPVKLLRFYFFYIPNKVASLQESRNLNMLLFYSDIRAGINPTMNKTLLCH